MLFYIIVQILRPDATLCVAFPFCSVFCSLFRFGFYSDRFAILCQLFGESFFDLVHPDMYDAVFSNVLYLRPYY